jgi:hypothetical protein
MVDLLAQVAALAAANAALQCRIAYEGQTHVLDFKRKVDLDVYHGGITPFLEGDNRFDLKPETLGQFLKLLGRKATDQGWNNASSTQQIGLFNVSQDDSFYSRITISITKEHYYIEMTALRAQYEPFMMGKDAQYQTHKNNQMLQECIWGSLTLRAQHRLVQYEDEYTVNGLCCGPLLLNLIKRTVTGNPRATIQAIRSQLNHIDDYAAEVEGNVEMITEFFTEHLRQLKTYGATLDNPMGILFKGLLAVPCEEFHHYISNKKNMYYDTSLTCTPKELVLMAQQEYMIMKTKAATPTTQSPATPREKCIGHGCSTRLRSSH